MKEDVNSLIDDMEKALDELHRYHIKKAKKVAHGIRKGLTDEDLLNPDNFTDIVNDPNFMYEDGTAAGVLSAKMLVMNFLKERLR